MILIMNKTHLIFDFDGTLADTQELIFTIVKELGREYGFELDQSKLEKIRQVPLRQAIKELKVPSYRLPCFVVAAQKKLQLHLDSVKLFPDIKELLHDLSQKKYQLGIVTSNSVENVETILEKNSCLLYFDFIHSEKNLFGKEKTLKKLLNKYSINVEQAVYLGDEVRDFEACQKLDIQMIAVAWGYDSEEVLRAAGVQDVITQPLDLTNYLD